jgi:hypothetical protein
MSDDRKERLSQSAQRGAEAAALLEHPLFAEIIGEQIEAVTQVLLTLPVSAHEDRLALCTTLGVLRRFKSNLEQIRTTGTFDARQLAGMKDGSVS